MTMLISLRGVALAAFAIWLTVRIVNRRERWAKRTAAALVLLFFVYPLSIGPALRLNHLCGEWQFVYAIYDPLLWIGHHGPRFVGEFLYGYCGLWVKMPG